MQKKKRVRLALLLLLVVSMLGTTIPVTAFATEPGEVSTGELGLAGPNEVVTGEDTTNQESGVGAEEILEEEILEEEIPQGETPQEEETGEPTGEAILGGELRGEEQVEGNTPVAALVYLNGQSGDDDEDGTTEAKAVKTFEKARKLAKDNQGITQIIVVGTTDIAGEVSLVGTKAVVIRGENFNGYLFQVKSGQGASLSNITIDGNSENKGGIEKSLIEVKSRGTLNIGDGTTLKNNQIKAIRNTTTKGGAIYASSARINMTGGVVENNQANYGGGIYLNKSTMNFSGGKISKNKATRLYDTDVNQYYAAGGGILIYEGSTLKMSKEAEVLSNYSDEVGGGISVGGNDPSKSNIFEMEGGTVESNIAGAAGGGIFVQAELRRENPHKAIISGGNITKNVMDGKGKTNNAFGGGGIYVNGMPEEFTYYGHKYHGINGELELTNVLVTNNQSEYQGAGYAACPISKTTIHVTDGGAIYGNVSKKTVKNDLYILCDYSLGLHSGDPEYKLSKRMLGGALYNWKNDDNTLLADDKYEGTLKNDKESLSLHTDSTGNELTRALAKVIISDNYSATRGGGIGSNGSVTIGTGDDPTEVSVTKIWDDDNNANNKRPESITVQLIANGNVVEERVLSEANGWETTFSDLPKKIGDNEISYTVREVGVEGYTSTITGDATSGFVITNKIMPATKIKVMKEWQSSDGSSLEAPVDKIEVELYKDGVATGKLQVLSKDNGWTAVFDDLEVAEKPGGKPYEYTVKEVGEKDGTIYFDGNEYKVAITGSMEAGFTIGNRLVKIPPPPDTPKTPLVPPPETPETPLVPPPETPETPLVPPPEAPETPLVPPENPKQPSKSLPKTGGEVGRSYYGGGLLLLGAVLLINARRKKAGRVD